MKAALRGLTLVRTAGGIDSELAILIAPRADGKDKARIRQNPDAFQTFVVFNGWDNPIAWAILCETNEIMVYVKRYHRRKGIGRMLLALARKHNPGTKIKTLVWSPTSAAFYTSSARPKSWQVDDWYGYAAKAAA
jgi:hypothetical protein